MLPARSAGFLALGTALLGLACGGGGDGGNGPGPQLPTLQYGSPDGNNQSGTVGTTLATPYSVRVLDSVNAPVANVSITWTVPANQGSVSAPTSTTNASGVASVTRTLGTIAGAQTATAAASGVNGSPKAFTATAQAGAATGIMKSAGDGGQAGVGRTVTYTVLSHDVFGNPKDGVVIDWAVGSGGGSIAPPQNTTAADGKASATRTLSATEGAHTATATANGISGAPSVTFTTTAISLPIAADASVRNNFFDPGNVVIAVGGTVTWTWVTPPPEGHNVSFVTAGSPANCATTSTNGATCPRTFTTVGTFNYACTIHVGMAGSVSVQ